MTAQPLPAPWTIVPRATLPEVRIQTDAGETVCLVLVNPIAPDQGMATARLLRGAPPMLAALQAVEEWWLTKGMHVLGAAPPEISGVRKAIVGATADEGLPSSVRVPRIEP